MEKAQPWKDKFFMRFLPLEESSACDLLAAYRRMEAEGTLGDALFEARDRSVENFMSLMLRSGTLPFILYWEGRECGFVWFTVSGAKACLGNCCIYREFWGRQRTTFMARGVYTHILTRRDDDGYLFDLVASLSAVSNPLSWIGAVKAGARKIGVIPNGLFCADTNTSVDAVLTVATRAIMGVEEA